MKTHLSVNINKIATLRNSRGGQNPNVKQWAQEIERMGAHGITVHPRPDERHIRYKDVYDIAEIITTELNIEGNPTEQKFIDLVLDVCPTQVTLVPDSTEQLTSNHGWNTIEKRDELIRYIEIFQTRGIRVSIFVDPIEKMITGAQACGTDRIELYTESYAKNYHNDREKAIEPYQACATSAHELGLEINAGHDLDLENLKYLKENLVTLHEVSIGHALISDALRYGMHNTVNMYLRELGHHY